MKGPTTLMFVLLFGNQFIGFGKNCVSIEKALKEKMIIADVTCKGGLCVDYAMKNLTKDSLMVVMPAGWRMNCVKEDYQDILVVHEQVLALRDGEKKSFEIKGYCCEASNSAPSQGLKYEQGKMADAGLLMLANYLNRQAVDENTEQYAVWSISNNKPTANITGHNDSLSTALRNFVAGLKGEPIPWYTLQKKISISGTDGIREYPVKLNAKVGYSCSKESYAWFYVVDSLGHKVGQITGQWLQPGSHEYYVNVNLRDFSKGKYKIILASKDEEFIEKEFEI
jgi:hypothetical protein